jgi:hypothetical protein
VAKLFIKLRYRADQRIQKVELKTGNTAFIVELEAFINVTDVRDFEESHIGEVVVPLEDYNKLRKGRVTYGEPTSFRFRRAKKESQKS